MESKDCFICKKHLTLDKFKTIPKDAYQQKSWLGVGINCRQCNISIELKQGAVRRVNGKFQIMEWTDEEIINDNML